MLILLPGLASLHPCHDNEQVPVEMGKSITLPHWRNSAMMRLALSLVAAVLTTALLAPCARAQATIPYRRTIDYIPNRPHEFTGRYVRINVSFSSQPGPMGRSITSLTAQPTINPGVGHGPPDSDSFTSGGGNDAAGGGGAGGGAGKTVLRGPGLRNTGFGRTFRFTR